MVDITPPPPAPPKRRRVVEALKAPFLWLKNRRSARAVARAIASNQVAVAALAASVAAAGLGSYATVEAVNAQNATERAEKDIASLKTRFATLSAQLGQTWSNVSGLLARTADLESASAIQLRALGFRTSSLARELSRLADQVAGMPSSEAQTAALAASVAEAASVAHRAMRKAERAATAAAEADDDEFARAAAAQAAVDAGLAADQAGEAQLVAEQAQRDADAAQVFPRTITIPDDTRTVNAAPYTRGFTVDLPNGRFLVELDADVTCLATTPWAGYVAPSTGMQSRTTGVGPAHLEHEIIFSAPGGTASFTVWLDGNVVGPGNITFSSIMVTISRADS